MALESGVPHSGRYVTSLRGPPLIVWPMQSIHTAAGEAPLTKSRWRSPADKVPLAQPRC